MSDASGTSSYAARSSDDGGSVVAFPRRGAPAALDNLPLELSSFVGRAQEMAEAQRLLARNRLLTLTGPGGCGKTRLALAMAAEMSGRFGDGVWLVELAPLSDPEDVEQISSRLDNAFRLLSGQGRTAAAHQTTLTATMDWSYDLLGEEERTLLRRLSVFAGGFALEAAEEVCSGEGIEEARVLDLLSSLVDKSLVMVEEREGEVRYRMLETIGQYGMEKLEGSGEAEMTRERHAMYYLALAGEAEPELLGVHQEAWLGRLEEEHDNLRAVLDWALENGEADLGLRIAGVLGAFWLVRGRLSEGRRWLEAALGPPLPGKR